jgi:hypothetical protein
MGVRLTQKVAGGARFSARVVSFCARRPREGLLLARMGFWVAALSLMVKVLPLPRAMAALRPRRTRSANPDPEATQARLAALLDMLLGADFWVFTPTCWKRAPVLYRYLALEGVETRVVFGMRKRDGDGSALDGHAWLEAGGRPVLEREAPAYSVTYVFPPAAARTAPAR